jgi:hypothetical protein
MNLQHLTDDARRELSVVLLVGLMAAAAVGAGVLGAFGHESGAQAALGVAIAASFPVLVGTFMVFPRSVVTRATHRVVRVGLAAAAVLTLVSVALLQPVSLGA